MAILRDERHALTRMRLFLPAVLALVATMSIAAAQPVVRTPASAVAPPAATAIAPSAIASPRRDAAAVSVRGDWQPGNRAGADTACWSDSGAIMSFSGTISRSGGDVITEIGTRDGIRIIEQSLDGTRVCMIAEGMGEPIRDERPSEWLARSPRIVIESQRKGRIARLTLTRQGGGQQASWSVNGALRTFDAAAAEWRDRMLGVLDNIWALSTLRGEVSTLRGEISTVYGQESTLRGRISTFEGEVSTLRGEQSTIRGEESSLRGEISSIRGHVSSLRGEISSEQGAISTLESGSTADRGTSLDARIARHNENIAQIERQIRDYDEAGKIAAVEQRIKALDVDGKSAAIDTQIRAFDLNGKIAAVEQQIKDLDVNGKVAAIQKQIDALDADRRGRQIEDRRDAALRQLESTLDRIK